MQLFPQVTSTEMLEAFSNPNLQILDVRPVDTYNGWKSTGDKRGGHIPGARSLPAKWSRYIDWIEIVRKKGIQPDHEIIVYGYQDEEPERIASLLNKAGYNNVSLYDAFQTEWIAHEKYPLETLARYNHLISAKWLKDSIEGKDVEFLEGAHMVVCHCHYRNHGDYHEGHIAGSISVDSLLLEDQETWNRRTPLELKKNLENLGINANSTVVVYGRFSYPDNDDPFPGSSAGHLGAIRCAFIMMYAGVKDVKVLNGGLQSWLDEGFEITQEETHPIPSAEFGVSIPMRPELAVDIPEAKEMLKSDKADLICVRSWAEYIGEVSGYNYIEKKGRIPGAVFGNCGSDAYHMENYRNLDHTILEANDVLKQWDEAGIKRENHNAFYCGTGWRGSEAFFNAWLMGWPRVSVFDGGWFEWSNLGNSFEIGEPDN